MAATLVAVVVERCTRLILLWKGIENAAKTRLLLIGWTRKRKVSACGASKLRRILLRSPSPGGDDAIQLARDMEYRLIS